MQSIDLAGNWQFRAEKVPAKLPPGIRGITRWMQGRVPGTVHTDLLAAGKITDPYE
jgi:hypothetical protein